MVNHCVPDCLIYGGGGHAAVVIECLRLSRSANPVAVLDGQLPVNSCLEGVPVIGGDGMAKEMFARGIKHFLCGVGSIGDSRIRKKIYDKATALGMTAVCAIHPSAIISGAATISDGVFVSAGAVINLGANIGANVIINSGAIIDHHCTISDHVHIASGAILSGGVSVGTGAHVGAGAVVRHQIKIGSNAVVGVGATVVKDVPEGATVFGERARIR